MKLLNRILFAATAIMLVSLHSALAQDATPPIPESLMNTPINKWQLNGVTALVVIQALGRAFAGLKGGGGLRGIWNGIMFGTNTPPTKQ